MIIEERNSTMSTDGIQSAVICMASSGAPCGDGRGHGRGHGSGNGNSSGDGYDDTFGVACGVGDAHGAGDVGQGRSITIWGF